MEDKIEEMDKDSLVATLATCNEKVMELKVDYGAAIAPLAKEVRELKERVTAYMSDNGIECMQLNEDMYLRLFHRVGGGETLTPLLFMNVVNGLTPAVFKTRAREIEASRLQRLDAWMEKTRKDIRKGFASARGGRGRGRGRGRGAAAARAPPKRVTKRAKIECMANAAQSLGCSAASHVSEILQAKPEAAPARDEEDEGEGGGGGGASGDDDDGLSLDERVERALRRTPFPEASVKYVGKNNAYAQRPLPSIGRPLTAREMFVEVLYGIIKDRHKPVKPIVIVDTRPGKSSVVVTSGPKTFFTQASRYVDLKARVAAAQVGNREKRREYVKAMNLCKTRLLPLLGNSKYEASMPTSGGLRTICIEVVKKEEVKKRLNLWEMSKMLDAASEGIESKATADAPVGLLTEAVMSHLIESVLRQISTFTTECTTCVERVRIRRSRERGDGDDDDDDESGDSGDDSDGASSFSSFKNE